MVISMNGKIMALFGVFLLGTGLAFALSGTTVSDEAYLDRWVGNATGDVTTEGGNITEVNLGSQSLTDKWAAFYGNISGSIVLTDNDSAGTYYVYMWDYNRSDAAGEVCVSTSDSVEFNSSTDGILNSELPTLDTLFGFASSDSDSINRTMTDESCNLTFVETTAVVNASSVSTEGSFTTCGVSETGNAPTSKGEVAFCTEIDDAGTNYKNEPAHYELMVPTNSSVDETETYYFYAELD